MTRHLIHYGIHFLVPVLVGLWFFKGDSFRVILILLAGILIDIDHLWAIPLYDPDRCSIGFHTFHSYWVIAIYISLLFFKPTRLIGLALTIHIIADSVDCLLM